MVIGALGLLLKVWQMVNEDVFDLRSLAIMVVVNEERILRIFIVVGTVLSYHALLQTGQDMCKRQLTKWGEIIIEPGGGAAGGGPAVAEAVDANPEN